MKALHGLVTGRFYPPHAGHHLLIRTAAALSERVTVVVVASASERIPLASRLEWLREVHPGQAHVQFVGVDETAALPDAIRSVNPRPVDVVFSSEPEQELETHLPPARHIRVDVEKELVRCSSQAVRENPVAHWDCLSPPARAFFARRIVLAGAESTGKTTLAKQLSEALCARGGAHALTRWVGEYGREFTLEKFLHARAQAQLNGEPVPLMDALQWTSDDFLTIALEQRAREEAAAAAGGPVLLCDTDAFATGIWHERYLGRRSAEVEAVGETRAHALYLLTHPEDVPFKQDGIRDGEHLRTWMNQRFLDRFQESGRPVLLLQGNREQRVQQALKAIDALLARGWGL